MASPLQHARLLPPSSAKRWRACAASAVIAAYGERVGEDTPHPNSIRGTLMHSVGEDVLRDWLNGKSTTCTDYRGRELGGQVFTAIEDKETQSYVNYVKKRAAEDPDSMVFLEQRLYFCRLIGAAEEDAFGSGDCVIVQPNLRRIIIIDLKTGKWEVEVEYNDQLSIYGAAALRKFAMFAPINTVEMVVFQRQAFSWEVSTSYMNSYIVALRRDVMKIQKAEREFKKYGMIPVGAYSVGDHCRFCKVIGCEAREKSVWASKK